MCGKQSGDNGHTGETWLDVFLQVWLLNDVNIRNDIKSKENYSPENGIKPKRNEQFSMNLMWWCRGNNYFK